MKKNAPLTNKKGTVRTLGKADMKNMRAARLVVPDIVMAAKKQRGRPAGQTKTPATIRFDHDVLAMLKASGDGWQTRVNTLLKAALGLAEK
jgi:uncharacterized protein (DUF4415 family)